MSPNATGFVVFGGEDTVLYFGTISPPSNLTTNRRIAYTVGVLNVIIRAYDVRNAVLEDYAHRLRSSATSAIREQGGAVKQMLLMSDVKIHIYNISTIKKFATGFGAATKMQMKVAFDRMTLADKNSIFRSVTKKRTDLTEHEIDAWFIGRLHYDNLRKFSGEDKWPYRIV